MLAASLVGAGAFAGPSLAGPEYKNQYPDGEQKKECPDSPPDTTPDTVIYAGPAKLWPPNHKIQETTVTATGDSDDEVTLEVKVTPTDEVGGDGGPNHDPDATYSPELLDDNDNVIGGFDEGTGSAVVDLGLRAERSGRGDGRTYTINFTATFSDQTQPCVGQFTVFVPHDMGTEADRTGRTNGNGDA
jgi:hypothetical protein